MMQKKKKIKDYFYGVYAGRLALLYNIYDI